MSNTAPSRADPVVVFPLGRWCPPQETSQPHPPQHYRQCWKFPQVRRSEADNFGGGPGTFCWFFLNLPDVNHLGSIPITDHILCLVCISHPDTDTTPTHQEPDIFMNSTATRATTQMSSMYQWQVETLYSTIYYSKYFIELNFDKSTQYVAFWTQKRHPIPRPFGRAMECLLWVLQQKLTVL